MSLPAWASACSGWTGGYERSGNAPASNLRSRMVGWARTSEVRECAWKASSWESSGLLRVEATTQEQFELTDAEKANYGIGRMVRLLNVSRSGYYAWRSRPAGPRARRQEVLDVVVRDAHRASDGVYGAPRVRAELAASGIHVDVKTVAASMRRQGLEGVSPRTFRPVTTIPGIPTHAILDLVEHRWDQGALNTVWDSDITDLRTA